MPDLDLHAHIGQRSSDYVCYFQLSWYEMSMEEKQTQCGGQAEVIGGAGQRALELYPLDLFK